MGLQVRFLSTCTAAGMARIMVVKACTLAHSSRADCGTEHRTDLVLSSLPSYLWHACGTSTLSACMAATTVYSLMVRLFLRPRYQLPHTPAVAVAQVSAMSTQPH